MSKNTAIRVIHTCTCTCIGNKTCIYIQCISAFPVTLFYCERVNCVGGRRTANYIIAVYNREGLELRLIQ